MLVFTTDAWLSRRLTSELTRYCPRAVCAPLSARDWTAAEAAIRMHAAAAVPVLILITWADLVDRTIADVQTAIDGCIARMRSATAQAGAMTVGLVPYGSYTDGSRCIQEYPSAEPPGRGGAPLEAGDRILRHREQREARYDLIFCPMVLLRRRSRRHPSALQAAIRIARGLADETRAKVPDYFSRYALTLRADVAVDVNASSPRQIVRWLADRCVHSVERTTEPAGRVVYLHSRVAWPTVCASLREAGLPLATCGNGHPLNAMDTLFNELVGDVHQHRCAPADVGRCPEAQVCNLDSSHVPAVLRAIASDRCRTWESSYEHVGAIADLDLANVAALHSRELHRRASTASGPDGAATPVRYREGGAGDVVLFLPPLGIGIEYYKPALESLLHGFRVIVWHPRAKTIANARSWIREELSRHVDDICRVLEHEGVTRCHVVAWCGGARLAARLLDAGRLQIQSLALMAPLLGGRDVMTRHAERVESVCRQLVDNSLDAERFLREAQKRAREAPMALEQFGTADQVRKSPLEYHPVGFFAEHTFSDIESMKDWAAATLENVADMPAVYERVRAFEGPMLIVLGTHDALVAYDRARCLVATMTQAILATVHGGNHYFLVEHGRAVTKLLRTFLRKGSSCGARATPCRGARIRIESHRASPIADSRATYAS